MRRWALTLALALGCDAPASQDEAMEIPDPESETAESSGGEPVCFDRHEADEMTYVEGDPRQEDPDYEWTRTMLLEGSTCIDCHQSPDSAKPPAEWIWDVGCQPVWTDSATDDDLVGFIARVLDPGEGRVDFTTAERERVASLVERELERRADRRGD